MRSCGTGKAMLMEQNADWIQGRHTLMLETMAKIGKRVTSATTGLASMATNKLAGKHRPGIYTS